jgi:hypothetical protein
MRLTDDLIVYFKEDFCKKFNLMKQYFFKEFLINLIFFNYIKNFNFYLFLK